MTLYLLISILISSLGISPMATSGPTEYSREVARAPRVKKVLLNFEAVELMKVVKTMSKLTGKNFILEDAVRRQRITIVSGSRVDLEEAYRSFVEALSIEGLRIEPVGQFLKITRRDRHPRTRRADRENQDGNNWDAISKISDTSYRIPPNTLDDILSSPRGIATQARIVPAIKAGKPVGFKLFSIRSGSLHAKLGIRNGDVIHKINGMALTSPDKALEMFSKLKDTKVFEIELIRRGKPITMTYRIE